jgi:hypothetical protein
MQNSLPRNISAAGGIFITLSGIFNLILGIQIGATHYYPYPGGKMGHVGITAGLAAIGIGLLILFALPRLYQHHDRRFRLLGAFLTFILGHAGAVFGALYVGPVGVFLCYVGGIWLLTIFLKET